MLKEQAMSGPQFHEIARALCKSNLPSSAKVVGFCLLDFANNDDNVAWPSLGTLASCCNMNRATVVRSVAVLTQCGWIDRIPTARNQSARRILRLGADLVGAPCASTRRKNEPTVGAPCAPNVLVNVLFNDSGGAEEKPKPKKAATPRKQCGFIPPTVAEVVAYNAGLEDAIDDDECRRFHEWFDEREWHDSKGRKVRYWKSNFATWRGNHRPKKRGLPYHTDVDPVDPGQEVLDAILAAGRREQEGAA